MSFGIVIKQDRLMLSGNCLVQNRELLPWPIQGGGAHRSSSHPSSAAGTCHPGRGHDLIIQIAFTGQNDHLPILNNVL